MGADRRRVPQLPTFVLALAMLVPATRSDVLFSTIFFLTRIAFHAVLSAHPLSQDLCYLR